MKPTVEVRMQGDREIVIVRRFAAPRRIVFEAMTQAQNLKRWLSGPPGWEMTECESDPRVGKTFRHVWQNEDGSAMAMHGVYREVVAPERVVRTETFEMGCDNQAGEQVATMVLAEKGGTTTLTLTLRFPSKAARDGMMATGFEHGMEASYGKLDALLVK